MTHARTHATNFLYTRNNKIELIRDEKNLLVYEFSSQINTRCDASEEVNNFTTRNSKLSQSEIFFLNLFRLTYLCLLEFKICEKKK